LESARQEQFALAERQRQRAVGRDEGRVDAVELGLAPVCRAGNAENAADRMVRRVEDSAASQEIELEFLRRGGQGQAERDGQ
jgi:hypothetical protein